MFQTSKLRHGDSSCNNEDCKFYCEQLVEQNRILMNSLNNILECPVCLTMVRTSPMPSCHNGHIMCSSCWNLTHLCPLCRVKLHETEKCFSQTANTLLQLVTLPCQYQDEGCSFQGKKSEVEEHQHHCVFGDFSKQEKTLTICPAPGCRVGQKTVLKKGVKTRNRQLRVEMSTRSSPSRRHREHCNRNFSRGYFNRHICTPLERVVTDPRRLIQVQITGATQGPNPSPQPGT